MHEFGAKVPGSPDYLFFERLGTFVDRTLADIKAFSEREQRSYEETRQYVAEWHSKYLFEPPVINDTHYGRSKVFTILCDVSRLLESLCEVTGLQSFVLAVNPNDAADSGFLGGSVMGREFWRGLRNGGDSGAKAFKFHCIRELGHSKCSTLKSVNGAGQPTKKAVPAKSLKSDLYDQVRTALRRASGVRNAEMKWTNPERLIDTYGVRLVGWPQDIPAQNPSTLKVSQNKHLLCCLETKTMRFEKIGLSYEENNLDRVEYSSNDEPEDDCSWAYNFDGAESSPKGDTNPSPLSTYYLPEFPCTSCKWSCTSHNHSLSPRSNNSEYCLSRKRLCSSLSEHE